jgi:hypothetical protein
VTSPAIDEDPAVIARIQRQALADVPSVTTFAQELIRTPSRGGIDDPEPILALVENWLRDNELPHRRLHTPDGAPAAVVIEIVGSRPGPGQHRGSLPAFNNPVRHVPSWPQSLRYR